MAASASSIKELPKVLTLEDGRALSAVVPCAAVAKLLLSKVAALPNPNVVLWSAAFASSNNAFPAVVKSNVAAVPEPVNWIPLSAAEVKPAIAAKSASYSCTSLPIANPKFVLASLAVVAPVPPNETPISVPCQVPAEIVPTVTISVVPPQLLRAIFSTKSKDNVVFTSEAFWPTISLAPFSKKSSVAIFESVICNVSVVNLKLPISISSLAPSIIALFCAALVVNVSLDTSTLPVTWLACKLSTFVVDVTVNGAVPVVTSDTNVCAVNENAPISILELAPSIIAKFCASLVVNVPADTSNVFVAPTVILVASIVPLSILTFVIFWLLQSIAPANWLIVILPIVPPCTLSPLIWSFANINVPADTSNVYVDPTVILLVAIVVLSIVPPSISTVLEEKVFPFAIETLSEKIASLSTLNVPFTVVALPRAPISTSPPPIVVFPVVDANILAESPPLVAIISPPSTVRSPVTVKSPVTVVCLLSSLSFPVMVNIVSS